MLRGLARSERFVEWDQSDATRPVPPCKNIPVPFRPKSPLHARRPIPPRGVSRSSRTRGGTRWTQAALLTRAWFCGRRSRVVLTPRRWRQVGGRNFTGDGGKQARSPRRARSKPLTPSRAGMPGDPGELVVTNACAFYHCARGCGCNGHPAFPAPFFRVAPRPPFRGGKYKHNSGASRCENTKMCLDYSTSLRARWRAMTVSTL